jgi:hypothetical protein
MARRRLLIYCPLGESRSFYRPRHAAPSLAIRFARRLSMTLVWVHRAIGYYYPPPRHRRVPALVQPPWPRLGTAYLAGQRRLNSYYPVFVAGQHRVAIRNG